MTTVLTGDTDKENARWRWEAELGVIQPQAKECLKLPAAGRSRRILL